VVLEKLGPIAVRAGCEEEVNLPLCRSVELCGRVQPVNAAARPPALDLFEVIVELDDGVEAVRGYCDTQGSYCLRDIRPGKYSLTVCDQMLQGWQIRDNKQSIDLAAGEKRNIVFTASKKIKTIHFQQSWKNAPKL